MGMMNKYQKAIYRISNIVIFERDEHKLQSYTDGCFKYDSRAIRELADKATPRKPIGDLHSVPHYRCPNCNGGVKMYEDSIVYPNCHHCGQKLLWE